MKRPVARFLLSIAFWVSAVPAARLFAQSPALKILEAGKSGEWRVTTLPDGRVETLYGGSFEVRAASGQSLPTTDPVTLALGFFEAEKELFAPGLPPDRLRVASVERSLTGQHVRLQQVEYGYPIDNAFFEVHLTAEGRVFHVSNSLVTRLAPLYTPRLTQDEAVELARRFLSGSTNLSADSRLRSRSSSSSGSFGSEARYMIEQLRQAGPEAREVSPPLLLSKPEVVLYAEGSEVRLVWKIILLQSPQRHVHLRVDAVDGRVLTATNLILFRNGEGNVFPQNPVKTPRLELKTLLDLDESGYLSGQFSKVYLASGTDNQGKVTGQFNAQSASASFRYEVSDTRISEVNLYYHVNRVHDYFKSVFGFSKLDTPMPVYARYIPPTGTLNNAYYTGAQQALVFGTASNNADFALENAVIYHEYVHAVDDQLRQIFKNPQPLHSEARGMGEGFADFFASALMEDPCAGTYLHPRGKCVKDLTNRNRYPEDANQKFESAGGLVTYGPTEEHVLGDIWAAALWDLRLVLGSSVTEKITFESLLLHPAKDARFSHGLVALISADQQLNGGINAAKIREVFNARGIFETDSFPILTVGGAGEFVYSFADLLKDGRVQFSRYPGKLFNGRIYAFSGICLPKSVQAVDIFITDLEGKVMNTVSSFKTFPHGAFIGFDGLLGFNNITPGDYALIIVYSVDKKDFKAGGANRIKIDNVAPPTRVFSAGPPPAPNKPEIVSVTPTQLIQGTKSDVVVRGSGFKGNVGIRIAPDTGLTFEGGKVDSESQITAQYTVAADAPTGDRTVTVSADGTVSNDGKITIVEKSKPVADVLVEKEEKESNDETKDANPIKANEVFKGATDPAGDIDLYVFDGKAGTNFSADVFAGRLGGDQAAGSQMDSVLALFDANLDLLTYNDDVDFDGGIYDSSLYYKLEKDGKYYLLVMDYSYLSDDEADYRGGPRYFYQLRVLDGITKVLDATPPGKPVLNAPSVIDSTSALGASWTAFDPESGIDGYRYAIGTSPGSSNVKDFTFTPNPSFYLTDLSLSNGSSYYVSVRAINRAGLLSEAAVSDPIRVQIGSARHLYVPRLISNSQEFTGIAVVNNSGQNAEAVYTAFNNQGKIITGTRVTNPKTLPLSAGEQKARLESELFGFQPHIEHTGWIDVGVSNTNATGFYLFGDNEFSFIDGADVQFQPVKDFILAKLLKKKGSSEFSLVNPFSKPVSVTLEMYDTSGTKKETKTVQIDARGRYFGNVDFIFDISTYTPGYIRGMSTDGVIAFEIFRDNLDIGGLNGLDVASVATQLYVAQLASGPIGDGRAFFTELILINPGTASVTVDITVRGNDGGLIAGAGTPSVNRVIAAGGILILPAASTFGLPVGRLSEGYIEVSVRSGTGVVGVVTFGTDDGKALASLPLQPTGKKTITLSHIAEVNPLFTGVTMLNPTANIVTVTVEVYERSGKLVGSKIVQLLSKEKRAELIGKLVEQAIGQAGGYVKITASDNIFCFELFGDYSLSILAAVPAQ
ncbi:MAG: DVUA0089 family protein [Acidobacteria bacterium]|nr:DVUA0089 family protein [Acidobacteriota bacterium]